MCLLPQRGDGVGVSITSMRRWGGCVYYLNEEMGWVCLLPQRGDGVGVSITSTRRWGGCVYYLNEEMGWVCLLCTSLTLAEIACNNRDLKSNSAYRVGINV